MSEFGIEGKTVAAVADEEDAEGYGSTIAVTFTDGTVLKIWGCGCCSSPTFDVTPPE